MPNAGPRSGKPRDRGPAQDESHTQLVSAQHTCEIANAEVALSKQDKYIVIDESDCSKVWPLCSRLPKIRLFTVRIPQTNKAAMFVIRYSDFPKFAEIDQQLTNR